MIIEALFTMKHLYLIFLLAITSSGFAQDFKQEWKEVIQLELDGKVKSAHEVVDKIYKKAKKQKLREQVIKCFFYQSKFIQTINENSQAIIINNLKNEIKGAKGSQKALLNLIYATILEKYSQNYRYTINQRTKLKQQESKDFLTWTTADFDTTIKNLYSGLLDDEKELRKTNISAYAAIFEISPYTDIKKMTVYDFLLNEILNHEFKSLYTYKPYGITKDYFKKPAEFIKYRTDTISDSRLKRIVELYQHNERHGLKNDSDGIIFLQYSRMKRFYPYFNDKAAYFSALAELEAATANAFLLQELKTKRAEYYFSITSKESPRNYHPEILDIIEQVLSSNENPNAKAEAETLKEKILGRKITLNIPNRLYQKQNYRAFVEYRNVDSLKISYYKIPIDILKKLNKNIDYHSSKNKFERDSILFSYIKNHEAFKTLIKVLPTKNDHFSYSTEILMDNLELGNYLLYFETKNPLGYPDKKPFAYHVIQVSDLDYLQEQDQENAHDVFQVLNRQTGKPVENVLVKNNQTAVESGRAGMLKFNHLNHQDNEKTFSELYFIKEKDTLYSTYFRGIKYSQDNEEDFWAKPMIYFDRAIYRPGQKVHFKGFIFKKQNKIKSVVPFVTVQLSIVNPDGITLKKIDVKTNEFGSFNGEYDIPKNVLTGEFYMVAQEPDDYEADTQYYNERGEHAFWDFADFDDNKEFKFNVEEYKRPTFEVSFDKIKENYTIGDKITITGNAKTLAGSNLSNVKVKYDINYYLGRYSYRDHDYADNLDSETITDENGNFKIEFVAQPDENDHKMDKEDSMFYTLKIAVTDLNGETRTATSHFEIGNKMLHLNARMEATIYKEDKNSIFINATTLNSFPINTKGKMTLIEISQKKFLINKARFPELFSIGRKEYEALFPYEPYDNDDIKATENKIYTVDFDTEKSKELDLSFLKNFKTGNYKIILEATDLKGNLITSENNFELASKSKKATNASLFTYNQLENTSNHFAFEIVSAIPDLYVTVRQYDGLKKKTETIIQLKNGIALVKIPKEKQYANDVQLHFSTIWENNYYGSYASIGNEETESKLDFEIRSMRNKIEPGSNENWSFIIKNSKMQSEVLASMYDASLDQFATGDWSVEKFRTYQPKPEIIREMLHWYDSEIRFENLYFYSKYYKTFTQEPRLYWFGFEFSNKDSYANTQYLKRVEPIASIPKNAKTVFGVVSDKTGPIPGANISVRGTKRSTQTDFDGYYQIDVEKGEIIDISFTGYNNSSVQINNEKNIDIRLKDSNMELQEVVVLGYDRQVIKAKSSTTVSAVSSETIYNMPVAEIVQSLTGNVAGLSVVASSGSPGSAKFDLLIRGMGSVKNSSEPLFVIDGVLLKQEEFLKINSADIESITVLKDTAATSVYGSRASNGVVIINTKAGKKELEQVKTRTNFNETAFFYPNLTTDEKGQISFNFTTPESLTKWKLRLFAHNKKAETGYFESNIISQKDIMVMPNMPRFLREKDTINLAVKVVNLTNEIKAGNAILLLYDAATNNAIDTITLNNENTKPFSCNSKQSVVVNWQITIPEGIQGLRYKVIAKSGNLTDGEENILPVLTDKILITESIPVWVKGKTKREFTFANLKNNTSTTLKNHSLIFEYTSNPVWLALQSLPYLMNYPHDCAEQTFSKYYANVIAEKILTSNPRIASLLEKWKNNKIPESKLKLNEELKSIVLAETPWLMDAESDDHKNQRLAIFMDLNTLHENNEKAIEKVEKLLLPSGGFAWFSGGSENTSISQHILSGLGHLNKLFPSDSLKYNNIISKGIPNLDRLFVQHYSSKTKILRPSTSNLHYLYTRSFFMENYPLSKKCDSLARVQIDYCKDNWLSFSLYEKGLLALIMNRFNEKDFAKKIITSFKETSSSNEEIGMYWIANNNGYGWYESNISTQALLIEAFAEIDNDRKTLDAMKVWLIKNKQASSWSTTKTTCEAVYALLYQGTDWTSIKENTKIKIGDEKILTKKLAKKDDEMDSGYLKIRYEGKEINSDMGTISVDNKTEVPGFGGVYWQYFETLENIKIDSAKTMFIDKKIYKKVKSAKGEELVALTNEAVKVGDLLSVRLIIKTDNNLEFVHLKDLRASCLEPVDVLSGYARKDGLSYYKSTKDVATNFFFDVIPKGTYVLEYDLRVTNVGVFNNGISTLQSMYSPEYSAHSINTKINVSK